MYLTKIGTILVKAEGFPGLDSSPAAENAIECYQPELILEAPVLERDAVAKRSLGGSEHAHGIRAARITFAVDAKGTNIAGIGNSSYAERIAPLLAACGLTAIYSGGDEGLPNSGTITCQRTDSATSCTIYAYIDGLLHKLVGCVGNLKGTIGSADVPRLEFAFSGCQTSVAAGAIPANCEDYFPLQAAIPSAPLRTPRFFDGVDAALGLDPVTGGQNGVIAALNTTTDAAQDLHHACHYDRRYDARNDAGEWWRDPTKSWRQSWGDWPERAIIYTYAGMLKIINADTLASYASMTTTAGWTAVDVTAVHAFNGQIFCCTTAGLVVIDLVNDTFVLYDTVGKKIGDSTVVNYATNAYGAATAAFAIVSNTTYRVHANLNNQGDLRIAVATNAGLSVIGLTATYDLVAAGAENDVADCHVVRSGHVYWCSQNDAAQTDYLLYKSSLPTADRAAIAAAGDATDRVILTLDTGAAASANCCVVPLAALGAAGNASVWRVHVLEGGSQIEDGLDRIVAASPVQGAFVIDEATSFANNGVKRYTSDYCTDLVHNGSIVGAYSFQETAVAATLANTHKAAFPLTVNGGMAYANDATFGRVLDFDGAADYCDFINIGAAGENFRVQGAFSFSIWINTDGVAANRRILSKYDDGVATAYLLSHVNDSKIYWSVYDDSAAAKVGLISDAVVSTGAWHHVVGTYDGAGVVALYIDTVAQTTANNAGVFVQIEDIATNFALGCRFAAGVADGYYDGKLHGLHFYNGKTLTQAEVNQLYREGMRRADGNTFLAGNTDVVRDAWIDPAHRVHVATSTYESTIDAQTNVQLGSINKIADFEARDHLGDFANLVTSVGLYSYFDGGRIVLDQSGNGNHLRTISGAQASVTAPWVGKAITLDGVADYHLADYQSDLDPGTGDYSLFMLLKHGTIAAAETLIDRRDAGGTGLRLYMDAAGNMVWYVSDDDGVSDDTLTSTAELDDDVWHSIAITRSGTTLTMYVDGVSDNTAAVTDAAASISGDWPRLALGTESNAASTFWEGEWQALFLGIGVAFTAEQIADADAYFRGYWRRRSFEFDLGNQVTQRPGRTRTTWGYVHAYTIANANPTVTQSVEEPDVAELDWYAKTMINNPGVHRFIAQVNDDDYNQAGAHLEVVANVCPNPPTHEDVDGVKHLNVTGRVVETTGNINDGLKLVFR